MKNYCLFFVCIITLSFGISGCATQVERSTSLPEEILEQHASINPFSIFYASNRQPSGNEGASEYYSTRRDQQLSVGLAEVFMKNPKLDWSDISRHFKHRVQDYLFPFALKDIQEYGTLELDPDISEPSEEEKLWLQAIDRQMEQSGVSDITIYIHGYYEAFDAPILTGLDIWRSMGCRGAFIAYSWPTLEKASAYAGDLDSSLASARMFRLMVDRIMSETRAEKVQILAHSAGTRLLVQALMQWRLSGKAGEEKQLGQVILAASDMDAYLFWNYLEEGILDTLDNLTLYVSDKDRVLHRSRLFHNYARLGDTRTYEPSSSGLQGYILEDSRLDIIDVSRVEKVRYWTGHYYFMGSPWVYQDIQNILKEGSDPVERELEMDLETGLWYFPDNYEEIVNYEE